MNNFGMVYKAEADKIVPIHIDINEVLDEGRRKRLVRQKRRQMTAKVLAAAAVLFLTTIGSVQAAEYIRNVIQVSESGFRSKDAAALTAGGGDMGKEAYAQDGETYAQNGETYVQDGEAYAHVKSMEEAAETEIQGMLQMDEEAVTVESYNKDTGAVEPVEIREYDSIEAFRQAEEAVISLPNIEEKPDTVQIWADDMMVSVRQQWGEKSILLDCIDYSGSAGHASSTVYAGGVCNERTYTTAQGFSYILVDSAEAQSLPPDVHAAVTVGAYEIYLDFCGYGEAEIGNILESIDLSVYP